jgi:hypothetical protein
VGWALRLLQMYPTAERIAAAHLASPPIFAAA